MFSVCYLLQLAVNEAVYSYTVMCADACVYLLYM